MSALYPRRKRRKKGEEGKIENCSNFILFSFDWVHYFLLDEEAIIITIRLLVVVESFTQSTLDFAINFY